MEQPNLKYLDEVVRGDKALREELIHVIKTEFPDEKEAYYKSLHGNDYKAIQEEIHRLKHKISFLGLEKSYEMANQYENEARKGNLEKADAFELVLKKITSFLATL